MSLSKRTKKWLAANCGVSLKGKTVLVTGANSGVGFKTAETAAYLGANVILACRNGERAAAAKNDLLRDYPDASVRVMRLDMASFDSIDAFVSELTGTKTDIHVFINNAGAFRHPGKKTANGYDLVIGTNYVGVYYLTKRLLPYLQSLPHEVLYIDTVSVVVKAAKAIDYTDFYCEKKPRSLDVYARSKLCLATYAYALADKLKESNIRVVMTHPGIAITPLGLNALGHWAIRLSGAAKPFFNSPEQSSLALAYALSHDVQAGALIGPHLFLDCRGYPKINRLPRRAKSGGEELIAFTEREIENGILRREKHV